MIVEEAAKKLKMNPQTLRLALQQRLFPFGVAIKTSESRYTYKIFETRLDQYLEGADYEKKSINWNTCGGCSNDHTNVGIHS